MDAGPGPALWSGRTVAALARCLVEFAPARAAFRALQPVDGHSRRASLYPRYAVCVFSRQQPAPAPTVTQCRAELHDAVVARLLDALRRRRLYPAASSQAP